MTRIIDYLVWLVTESKYGPYIVAALAAIDLETDIAYIIRKFGG